MSETMLKLPSTAGSRFFLAWPMRRRTWCAPSGPSAGSSASGTCGVHYLGMPPCAAIGADPMSDAEAAMALNPYVLINDLDIYSAMVL